MDSLTPYTVTVMQANVQGDVYSFQPCFLVDKGKGRVSRWYVQLTGTAAAMASARGVDADRLHEAMLRVHREDARRRSLPPR